jgi:hypothetical protein
MGCDTAPLPNSTFGRHWLRLGGLAEEYVLLGLRVYEAVDVVVLSFVFVRLLFRGFGGCSEALEFAWYCLLADC